MKKYLLQRRNSIGYAWKGLVVFFSTEANATIHLSATLSVLVMAWIFSVSRLEWLGLIIAIGLVILAEVFNTVLEKVADFIQPNIDPQIELIKDMAAAGVLWSAIIAIVLGAIIFFPYIISWINI